MRSELRWHTMRLAMWLARMIPCAYTERLRNAQVSNCMRGAWF